MKRNLTLALVGLLILAGHALPVRAGSGAGAIVLSFPTGARYNALGEAGSALAQDANANWHNPGGLAFMGGYDSKNLEFMYSKLAPGLADDIRFLWMGYASGFQGGGYGFSFTYLDMGEQAATDEQGNDRGTFNSYEFVLQGAMAFQLSENAGLGLGAKYFRDKLASDDVLQDGAGGSGDSYGVDLGLHYKIPAWKMNLAVVGSNLGFNNEIKHVDEAQADPMPRKLTGGMAWAPPFIYGDDFKVILVADYHLPLYKWDSEAQDYGWGLEKDQEEFGGGVEFIIVDVFAPRVGWKSAKYGDINGMTWGFGFDLRELLEQDIQISFASVPQAEGLDSVKRFSVSFTW